jgi:L-aminopeptidase/D-esterase-like protein
MKVDARILATILCAGVFSCGVCAQAPAKKSRARDLGVPFEGAPGPLNAITDVQGVEVGHSTIVRGEGKQAVRTGVTAVLPRGKDSIDLVFGGWFSLNGNGEMTGTTWLDEGGFLEGPVMITNTSSVGVVRDAVITWQLRKSGLNQPWSLPVVAETWDGWLNDIGGMHVKAEHAWEAIEKAQAGPVSEGNVGGGTGMVCHEFKGGIGTASRKLSERQGGYTVGVLVQCNYGSRHLLRIAGAPVGQEITEGAFRSAGDPERNGDVGSIIIVIATDAPLIPYQLKRIVKRAALGLARNGSIASNGSGDIFVAFSTANPGAAGAKEVFKADVLPNERMSALFEATVMATEEAVINALVAAETMTGYEGHTVAALPHGKLRETLKKYNRLR